MPDALVSPRGTDENWNRRPTGKLGMANRERDKFHGQDNDQKALYPASDRASLAAESVGKREVRLKTVNNKLTNKSEWTTRCNRRPRRKTLTFAVEYVSHPYLPLIGEGKVRLGHHEYHVRRFSGVTPKDGVRGPGIEAENASDRY
jgi:hypothetical protein